MKINPQKPETGHRIYIYWFLLSFLHVFPKLGKNELTFLICLCPMKFSGV